MNTITPPSAGTSGDVATPVDAGVTEGQRSYRYPGSPPFRDVDLDRRLFKGRSQEAKKVFHSILSSDVFLLYAVSGMGKSSLLNAGVMHRLRARGYWPVSIRLNETTLSPVQSIERQITEADIRDTEVEVIRTPGLDFDIPADTTLWDLLGSLEVWRDDRLQHLVLVLDQFEELFTLDWQPDVRKRFITQLGEVVRRFRTLDSEEVPGLPAVPAPHVKICIVIREDSLGELEALADDVPQIMQSRFRLGALDPEQAESAIREPAMVDDGLLDTQPFHYSEEAAGDILDFLQETERAATLGVADAGMVHSVDPSQLQIICQYVERRVLPDKDPPATGEVVTIEAADLGGPEGLRSVLGDFYRRTVGSFPAATQRSVQHLCEDGLISRSGRRLSLEREEISEQYGVAADDLDELVDQRLLRVEPRVGSEYYELSHDTLVKPILTDRSERRKVASRRHRRRAFIAVGIVSLAVLGFLAYRVGYDEGSESAVALTFGDRMEGTVENAGDVERFTIVGREQPSLILVEPSGGEGLDADVVLTNSSKVERDQDQLRLNQSERLVVPAAPGEQLEVAVGSKDASTGAFAIRFEQANVRDLTPTEPAGESISGRIDEPGLLAVYSVNIEAPSASGTQSYVELDVTTPQVEASEDTQEGKPAKEDPGLDVELEVINPAGVGTSTDQKAAGGGEHATFGGAPGQYLVVVRDHGTGIGPFEITATTLDVTTLSADGTETGEVTATDGVAAFAVEVPADGAVDLTVQPDETLDPMVNIVDPGGFSLTFDSVAAGEAEVPTLSDSGLHIVRVSGYGGTTGSFQIAATTLDVETLSPDGSENGDITSDEGVAAYDLEVPADGAVDLTVQPVGTLDPMVEIIDPAGQVSSFDSFGEAEAEVAFVSVAGRHIVRVTGFEGSTGSFAITTSPAETPALVEGEPVSATSSRAFTIDATGDQVVSVRTDGDLDPYLEFVDARGESSSVDSAGPGGTELALLRGDGPHELRVGVYGGTGSYEVETATVGRQDLSEGESRTIASPAVFGVDVVAGQLLIFTADSDDPDGVLALQVIGPDGVPIGYWATPPAPGDPVTTVIDGSVPGSYQIIVDSSEAASNVRADLAAIESQEIVENDPVTAVTPTAFSVNLTDGQGAAFTASPGSTESILTIRVRDVDGLDLTSAVSPAAGEPATVSLIGLAGPVQIIVTSSDSGAEMTATLEYIEAQRITVGSGPVAATAPGAFAVDVVGDERRVVIVTPQGEDDLYLEMDISGPGRPDPVTVFPSVSGEPLVALLAGEGTHRINVHGDMGGEAFLIEIQPLAAGP